MTIEPGVTVEAQAGTVVKLSGALNVNGTLTALGTNEASILFTSASDLGPGEWSGIKLNSGAGASELSHATVRYATTGIAVSGSSPTVTASSVSNNKTAGITVSGGQPKLAENTLDANRVGIEFSGSPDIDGNTIRDCKESAAAIRQSSSAAKANQIKVHNNLVERCGNSGTAAISVPGTAVTMGGNTVRESKGQAISYGNTPTNTVIPPDITENTLENNAGNAIWVNGELTESAAWRGHGFPIVAMGGSDTITVGPEATLTLEPGVAIKIAQFNASMVIRGTLRAAGTGENPVRFTSLKDDGVEGDTNMDGNATAPAAGDYIGVRFVEGSSTVPPGRGELDHVVATYGGAPASCGLCGGGGPMFSFGAAAAGGPSSAPSTFEHSQLEKTVRAPLKLSGKPLISHNELVETSGIEIAGSPDIDSNTIRDCREGGSAIRQSSSAAKTNQIKVHNNLVERCGNSSSPAISVDGTAVTMGGNTVRESKGQAISYGNTPTNTIIPPDIDDNTLEGNASNAIWANGELTESAVWQDHGFPIVGKGGSDTITVGPGATLTLEPGLVIKIAQFNASMIVRGTLRAAGTADNPVRFTSIKDDSIDGDTNMDGATAPAAGEYIGVRFVEGSSTAPPGRGELDHVVATYGGAPASCGQCGGGGPMFSFGAAASGGPTSAPSTFEQSRLEKTVRAAISLNGKPRVAGNLLVETSGIEFSGSADIDGNTIRDCKESAAAIRQSSSAAKTNQSKIHNNLVERCGNSGTAAISVPGTAVTMSGNTVRGSKGKAISYGNTPTNTVIPPDIYENTLEGNASNAIWVNGELTESATWKDRGFPIVAMGGSDTITVGPGAILKLEPGVAVKVAQFNATMIIRGTLWADGTTEDPVLLTSLNDDTVGGDTNMDGNETVPVAGEYIGVRFTEGSATAPPGRGVLDHVNATYGGAPASCGICGGGGPLFNFGAPALNGPIGEPSLIAHSRLEQTVRKAVVGPGGPKLEDDFLFKTPGLEFSGAGSPEVSGSTIKDCNESSAAIIQAGGTSKGSVRIHGNTVERCGNGSTASIQISGSGLTGLTLGGNTIRESSGQAINYSGDIPPDLVDNTLENNASDEIWVSGTLNQSATWHSKGAIVRINGSLTIPAGVSLTITEGLFLRNPKMTVSGTLKALGSAQRPVVFTGLKEEAGGEWGGVSLEPGSGASVLDYVELAYGGSGGPMLNIKGVSPTITHSTLRRSSGDGIRVQQSGHPTIEGNRFRNNNFGLRYEGEGKLSAPGNDWGCANGPKPTGCGDQVTSNVEWQPAVALQELPRLCPGSNLSATSNRCLLNRYEPTLYYDTEENYFADSAAEITDNWGDEESGFHGQNKAADPYTNSLWDGDAEKESPNFGLLAQSQPGVAFLPFQLTPSALGSSYPNGQAADANDWLGENEDFQQDNERMEQAGYLDAVYGRAFADGSGKRWLEYWFWYYYNPKDFAGLGHHQGDWESVVVQLDEHNKPEAVILSQHTGAASCDMEQIERGEEGAPIVYVGLDSHANYPWPGRYEATGEVDHADGGGRSAYPGLVVIESSAPSWLSWPGHWGNSRAEVSPIESDSPTGPAFHKSWQDPPGYAAEAGGCFDSYVGPDSLAASRSSTTAPSIETVTLVADEPVVHYEVPTADGEGFWPRLRITIDRLGDGGAAPASRTISAVRAKGALKVPVELEPGEEAELRGSLVYADGRRIHLPPKRVRFK
ncbi:MAG: right-handed parallel beta-helix repeat-containing protein [Solirubrobacterales bacterium]